MRVDGRTADALRPVSIERGYTKQAAGSVLVAFGDTKVICTASMENRVPPWLLRSGQGWVTAEYSMLPGSSPQRVKRDAAQGGRAKEISRLIGRALRGVTDLRAIGECTITLDCDVIQADGGTRTAAITGAYVALHDALRSAVTAGYLSTIPLNDACAAVSVGIVEGEALLDLNYAEDAAASVDLNVVMDDRGRFLELQGTAEGDPFDRVQLDAMLALAEGGVARLIRAQQEALKDA